MKCSMICRMKPYKATLPEKTITRIRNLLLKNGILTTEKHFSYDTLYYSCRVTVENELHALNEGCNGKGMTPACALASAYGELMERIENRLFAFRDVKYASPYSSIIPLKKYMEKNSIKLSFRFYPDEQICIFKTKADFIEYVLKFIPSYKTCIAKETEEQTYTVLEAPYYNIMQHRVELVPFELFRQATGSTGMCAGNVPEEAILQGINEIFERYVLQRLYINRLTPPIIPNSYFADTPILECLQKLQQQQNITFEIRDCSLGEGFPVIGLLLVDRKNNKYAFRLGADISPEIALERCYTETFQGVEGTKNHFSPVSFKAIPDLKADYNKNIIDGNGQYPYELLFNNESWKSSLPIISQGKNFKEDLHIYFNFIQSKNGQCYIRDNSFLGFPAYHIFISGLSETNPALYPVCHQISRLQKENYQIRPEYHLKTLNNKELSILLQKYETDQRHEITLFSYDTSACSRITRTLLLALGYYKTGNSEKAHHYMTEFLNYSTIKHSLYYYCVRDFFFWHKRRPDYPDILEKLYGTELMLNVCNDLKEPERIFDNFSFSNCFHCKQCTKKTTCRFKDILHFENNIQKIFAENLPNQHKLATLSNRESK